jgi:hypothetical protein
MPMFILSINWTDQGIRNVKDAPKRAQAARDLGKKVGVDIKQIYLTSGESDLLAIVDAQTGDTSPSSRWRSARRATCAPAPRGRGRRANSRSSCPNCRKAGLGWVRREIFSLRRD